MQEIFNYKILQFTWLSIKLFLDHLPFLLTSGVLFNLDKIAATQKNT